MSFLYSILYIITIIQVIGDSTSEASLLMKREGVRSVPSFHFWKGGKKVRRSTSTLCYRPALNWNSISEPFRAGINHFEADWFYSIQDNMSTIRRGGFAIPSPISSGG